ncbi:2-deoxystreptamine glucosyltransferase [bacterium HR18]|nr:2-deoxystreptamine glucosyltransferase [bacterium HR18]
MRVAILTNIIAPYRVCVYRRLGKEFETVIFVSGSEENRKNWSQVQDQNIHFKRVWGFSLAIPRSGKRGIFDYWYLHINPGYLTELIRFAPDAVISSEMGFRSLMALLYAKAFRKPLWVWWGGTLHTERSIGSAKALWRKVFARLVPRWISYGKTSTEYLLHLGIPRKRILEIQNCVDETLFARPTSPAFTFSPKPVLLYVGQLIERKGVDLLLESAARVQSKGYTFTLVLVGDGPEKERLERKAVTLGLRYVHFFPSKKPEEMPAVYRSADVLVFPTLEDVWGLVVNEALWSGIPVASSIYAGCTSEIVPLANRFDPLSPEDFDDALERAIKGELAPPNTSVLLTCEEVSRMIVEDIQRVLAQ